MGGYESFDKLDITPAPTTHELGHTPADLAWRAQVSAQSLARLEATREATERQGKALIAALKQKLAERLKELEREAEGEAENLRFLLAERRSHEGKTLRLLTDSGNWAEVSFRSWPTQGERDGKRWRITAWDEAQVIQAIESGSVEPGYGAVYERTTKHASKQMVLAWFLKSGEIVPGCTIEEETRPDQVSVKLEKPELTDGR